MDQVSLYLEQDIFRKVENAAHLKGVSISNYVASIIQEHFNNEWPSDYTELFGSVTDDTFFPYGAEKIVKDTMREPL